MRADHHSSLFAPATPVSPDTPVLDYRSNDHDGWQQKQCDQIHLPMSPQSVCSTDLSASRDQRGTIRSRSFEDAMADMKRDRKALSVAETKYRRPNGILQSQPKTNSPSPTSSKLKSRERKVRSQSAMRPPALCATHPALYSKPHADHKQTMLSASPSAERCDFKPVGPRSHSFAKPSPLPPWRTYNDPNRQISADPQFNDPKYRMLKMDVNPHQPNVISPAFMIGLPCGSMIEGANVYPETRVSIPRDVSDA